MTRLVASSLVILLAAPRAASPRAGTTATPLSVAHSPVGCMIAGTNPQIDAGITPLEQVQVGRVYFKSALGDVFYYVEMAPQGGRYVGVLPRPRPGAGPVTYYVEAVGRDFAQGQTPEQRAALVEKPGDCGDKPVAALGPADPVRVFSISGGSAMPPGFAGVSSVVAGTGTATAGGGLLASTTSGVATSGGLTTSTAGGAATGGRFLTSTAGIITVGAAIAGVTTVFATTGGDEPAPVSPTR